MGRSLLKLWCWSKRLPEDRHGIRHVDKLYRSAVNEGVRDDCRCAELVLSATDAFLVQGRVFLTAKLPRPVKPNLFSEFGSKEDVRESNTHVTHIAAVEHVAMGHMRCCPDTRKTRNARRTLMAEGILARIGKGIVQGVVIGVDHAYVRSLVEADRDAACEVLKEIAHSAHPDALDRFEAGFLEHSAALFGQAHHVRAMQLFSFFKMCEFSRFGYFRGFTNGSAPLN
jgi:hypothetical protein